MKSLKKKTNRPNAWDADVKRLLIACGGDVDKAAALILDQISPYQIFKEEPQQGKIRPIVTSYNPRDCETHYRCTCGRRFGSWDLFHQDRNSNGTNKYCPKCKIELDI